MFELALSSVVEAIDSGALRPADPLTVALTMWSTTHGVVDMLLMGFPFDDATRRMLVDSVIDTVLTGLATPDDPDDPEPVVQPRPRQVRGR